MGFQTETPDPSMILSCSDIFRVTPEFSPRFLSTLKEREQLHKFSGRWNNLERRLGEKLNPTHAIIGLLDPSQPDLALMTVQLACTSEIPSNIDEIITGTNLFQGKRLVICPFTVSQWKTVSDGTPVRGGGIARPFLNLALQTVMTELWPDAQYIATLSPFSSLRDFITKDIDQDFLKYYDRHNAIRRKAGALREETQALPMDYYVKPEEVRERGSLAADLVGLAGLFVCSRKSLVANLHLKNGAVTYRVCIGANTSSEGCAASWGLMANYLYPAVERNMRRAVLPHSQLMVVSR